VDKVVMWTIPVHVFDASHDTQNPLDRLFTPADPAPDAAEIAHPGGNKLPAKSDQRSFGGTRSG
jgi:hypothetical protein